MKKILSILFSLLALSILIGLGTWQTERLAWKTEIINRLESEYAKDPKQNIYTFDDLTHQQNNLPLLYGSVIGSFDYKKGILVGPKPLDGEIGYLVITPMTLKSGGHLLVNRGWISQDQTKDISAADIKGNISVSGIFRKPDWNKFTPNNSPENNIWTKLDIDQIARVKNISPVAPVMLYAEHADKDFGLLTMQSEKWFPRNKHKQYALFWFTMAGAMLIIFGLFWRQQKKPS